MTASGVVGVDFGTATTLVAEHLSIGAASVLPLGRVTSWLPSIARTAGDRIVVGEDADEAGPEQIRSIKRAITERRETVSIPGPDGPREVEADAVIVEILREIVRRAQTVGVDLHREREVRLGCPAMWDGAQRRRMLSLAAAAGLPVTDAALIDEPVAAGIAWLTHSYLRNGERPRGNLLVFDMGGGTLDIAVLSVAGGPQPEVAVLASLGMSLAGDALDASIARDIAAEMAANRIDVTMHPQPELAWGLLERAARETKTRLTAQSEHPVVLPRQLAYPQPVHYRREQLEEAFRAQMDGAENLIVAALRTARMAQGRSTAAGLRALPREELVRDIDFVLLAGGMSRIPYVGQRLSSLFPKASVHSDTGVAPEETVVAGLADIAGYERVRLHRPSFDLVLEWDGGRHVLYEAYTPLFEPWQVYNGDSDLSYAVQVPVGTVPATGEGVLRGVTLSARRVDFSLDGVAPGGLRVEFGPQPIGLRVFGDGRLEVIDGRGALTALRADAWPVVRGPNPAPLALRPA